MGEGYRLPLSTAKVSHEEHTHSRRRIQVAAEHPGGFEELSGQILRPDGLERQGGHRCARRPAGRSRRHRPADAGGRRLRTARPYLPDLSVSAHHRHDGLCHPGDRRTDKQRRVLRVAGKAARFRPAGRGDRRRSRTIGEGRHHGRYFAGQFHAAAGDGAENPPAPDSGRFR